MDSSLPPIPCLPGELNQVLLNMIVNAAHAIDASQDTTSNKIGKIQLTTRLDGNWAEIKISDTGSGIPDDIRTKIFDPFFTTKEVGKGTGQGLAISRSIVVDKHGGAIHVESRPDEGTSFTIRLPVS